MVQFTWTTPPTSAFKRFFQAYTEEIRRTAMAIALRRAPEIENWMKENAVWEDRTGNARQTLYTEVNNLYGVAVEIVLSHGVDYGQYLEVVSGGVYAIVGPALDYWGRIVWNDVRNLMR